MTTCYWGNSSASLNMKGQVSWNISFPSSSFTCGLAGALASNPIDVVRTRMMNQRSQQHGGHSHYKGTLDCMLQVSSSCVSISQAMILVQNLKGFLRFFRGEFCILACFLQSLNWIQGGSMAFYTKKSRQEAFSVQTDSAIQSKSPGYKLQS